MANNYFEFKQFTIHHDRCAMKVGTDGVLLGAWAPLDALSVVGSEEVKQLLDVGTGTGLIALQLAQRTTSDVRIAAIELDADAAAQARENVARSPWAGRIAVHCCDFRTYQPDERFHLIVSNPPYFVDALKCPDGRRNTARHTDTLSYDLLFRRSSALLANGGRVAVIIPSEVEAAVMDASWTHGFLPLRRCRLFTKPGKPCRRLLLAFSLGTLAHTACREEELYIRDEADNYTPEYIALTHDFYLKM